MFPSAVERLSASAGVVLPANVLTGHRNVTAKISCSDFPREFEVDGGRGWFPRGLSKKYESGAFSDSLSDTPLETLPNSCTVCSCVCFH